MGRPDVAGADPHSCGSDPTVGRPSRRGLVHSGEGNSGAQALFVGGRLDPRRRKVQYRPAVTVPVVRTSPGPRMNTRTHPILDRRWIRPERGERAVRIHIEHPHRLQDRVHLRSLSAQVLTDHRIKRADMPEYAVALGGTAAAAAQPVAPAPGPDLRVPGAMVTSAVSAKTRRPSSTGDRPPMYRRPLVPAFGRIGQFGVVLDDRTGRGLSELSLNQHPVPTVRVRSSGFLSPFSGMRFERSPSAVFPGNKASRSRLAASPGSSRSRTIETTATKLPRRAGDQSVAAAKPDDKYTPIHVGGSHGNFPRFTASTKVAWSRSV